MWATLKMLTRWERESLLLSRKRERQKCEQKISLFFSHTIAWEFSWEQEFYSIVIDSFSISFFPFLIQSNPHPDCGSMSFSPFSHCSFFSCKLRWKPPSNLEWKKPEKKFCSMRGNSKIDMKPKMNAKYVLMYHVRWIHNEKLFRALDIMNFFICRLFISFPWNFLPWSISRFPD